MATPGAVPHPRSPIYIRSMHFRLTLLAAPLLFAYSAYAQTVPPPPPDPIHDEVRTPVNEPNSQEVYTYAEETAEFLGGEEARVKYLVQNIKYPAMERDAGVQGKVFVRFVVDTAGVVRDAEVMRGVPNGLGLGKEALRVVNAMPKWKPARMKGKPVPMQMTMPVNFTLK